MPKNSRLQFIDQALGDLPIGASRDLRVALAIAAASAQDGEARSFLHDLLSSVEQRVARMPGYDRAEIKRIYSAAQTSISFIDHIMTTAQATEDEGETEEHPFSIN